MDNKDFISWLWSIAPSLIAVIWFFSKIDSDIKQFKREIKELKDADCLIPDSVISRIENKLILIETNCKHSDQLTETKISASAKSSKGDYEKNKSRIFTVNNNLKNLVSHYNQLTLELSDIKNHIIGLQQGLKRNGVNVRLETQWLDNDKPSLSNDDMSNYDIDNSSFFND